MVDTHDPDYFTNEGAPSRLGERAGGTLAQDGTVDVVEVPIVQSFDYGSFEDYWSSWSTGPTRIAQRLQALPPEKHAEIERHVRAGYLAGLPDGPRSFAIIVRAVRGTVPASG